MIRRIILENFMSHPRTVIEPAPGLTVLVGPNNCGKSAVAEALATVASNSSGDFMVRHGASTCRVVVETDDGHTVEWRRKGNTVSYRIDGRDIHRLNRSIPEGLHEVLRLPAVEVEGSDPFDIHIAEQKSPIFLLDRQGRPAAAFFASSSDAGLLLEMQRRHKARVLEWRREEEERSRTIERLAGFHDALEPLAEIEGRLEGCEALHETLREEAAALERLGEDLLEIERARSRVAHGRGRKASMASLAPPPALADSAPLEALIGGMAASSREAARLESRIERLASLPAPPRIEDVQGLARDLEALEAARSAGQAAAEGVHILERLAPAPSAADTGPLEALIAGLAQATHDAAVLAIEAAALKGQADGTEAEIERWIRENPSCPVCGAAVDRGRLLGGRAHEHP